MRTNSLYSIIFLGISLSAHADADHHHATHTDTQQVTTTVPTTTDTAPTTIDTQPQSVAPPVKKRRGNPVTNFGGKGHAH